MKFWKTALSIFALSASLALAEDLRTTKGKEYKNATVSRVEPDGIVIKFKGGIVKILFTSFPRTFKSGSVMMLTKLKPNKPPQGLPKRNGSRNKEQPKRNGLTKKKLLSENARKGRRTPKRI